LQENQDRSLWNRGQIAEGALLEKALKSRHFGSYTLQAAIAAVHAEAESVTLTHLRQIVALYNRLVLIQPSPVVQLNRAVAIAMRDGPEAGLAHIDAVLEHGELASITWRIQPARICTAGWAGPLRPGPLMRKLWR